RRLSPLGPGRRSNRAGGGRVPRDGPRLHRAPALHGTGGGAGALPPLPERDGRELDGQHVHVREAGIGGTERGAPRYADEQGGRSPCLISIGSRLIAAPSHTNAPPSTPSARSW